MTKRLVLVLGPHRTGTSVAAAALPALGADPRLETVYANAENAKGFHEHPLIVAFDDRALARIGTAWDDPGCDGATRLAAAGLDDGRLDDLVAEGAALIDTIFADAPLGAVKDPRMCLLLPLWARILTRAGYRGEDILQLHVTRDPYETARSQMLRQRASPDFYDIGQTMAEGAVLWLSHAGQALDALDAMRRQEGEALARDMLSTCGEVRGLVATIRTRIPEMLDGHRRRLADRVGRVLETRGVTLGEAEVAREIAFLADRADIAEELVRLLSHVDQFERLLGEESPGRSLDFLSQELAREANTIAAKSPDVAIAHAVVDLKTRIERLREMLQNVE